MQINLGKGRAEVPPHRLQQSLFLSVHKGNKGNEIYIVHELNKLTKLNRKIARFERFFLFCTSYICTSYILLSRCAQYRTPRRRLSRGTRSSWSCRSGRLSEQRMPLGRRRSSSDPLHELLLLHERLQNGCLIRQPYKRIWNPCIPTSHCRRVSRRRIMSVK